jgi:two-component system, cell cycle sensor histidine kinase and response regulator CckA
MRSDPLRRPCAGPKRQVRDAERIVYNFYRWYSVRNPAAEWRTGDLRPPRPEPMAEPETHGRVTGRGTEMARELFQLLEDLPVGFLVVDDAGIIVRVSPAAAEHLGKSQTEVVGYDLFREVMPGLSEVGRTFRSNAPTGRPVRLGATVDFTTPSGDRTIHVSVRAVRLGAEVFGVALIQDQTPVAEEERRRKRAESLASLGELAAGLAHEVNNPLASIKSFGQLLAREATSEEQRHALELIVHESERIGRTVENLVAFARQQGAGGREPLNLSTLVEQVIEVRRYSLEAAGVEVRMDLDASISAVMGEPGALQQVILNLVTRAESDLAGRRAERMLIVRTRESSEGVMLYVVDNGPGIPREALPHLFDAFGPAAEGQSLDLATSARIVRDHGGYIFAESEPGRGAAFFLRLPRAGGPPLSAPVESPTIQPRAARRSLRILVADDEPTLRLAIALFLKRRGHQVTQAKDAYEGLALARETDFDVALVDARMPGDGLALLDHLETIPSLRGRTALMTGDLGRARTSQGISTGRPYLVKPFDMNEAVNLLEKLGAIGE